MRKINDVVRVIALFSAFASFTACASTPAHESTGEYLDDTVITAKVKTAFASDDVLKSYNLSVETDQGVVRLTGNVDSEKNFNKAAEIVMGVKGLKGIKNNIIVK